MSLNPPTCSVARPTRNIVISGTNFWNPGDDFVRDGVIHVLRRLCPAESLNLLFYNFNADFFPQSKFAGISNLAARGDLDQLRDFVDAVVIAGLSAGDEIKDLYRWIIANQLQDRVYLVGAGYENEYVAHHIGQEPEATIFQHARLIIGRTRKVPEYLTNLAVPYRHLNCPAILSVPQVRSVPPGRKIERIGFSIQLPHGTGLANHSCAEPQYQLAMNLLHELSLRFEVEVIAHHKSEYFHFLKLLQGKSVPVHFSSFYHDLFALYPRYDLLITTRLHASLFANGHGIPGIIINDTDRHTHTLEGFPHSTWVNTRAAFDEAFARFSCCDLSKIAAEAQDFKSGLEQQYLDALSGVFIKTEQSSPPDSLVSTYTFDAELKEQALVRSVVTPGMTVFDVGANVGKYTKLFSLLVGTQGRVFAFEPDPDCAQRIRDQIAADQLTNVTLVQAAVCEAPGQVVLNRFPAEYCSWNSLGRPLMEDPRAPEQFVPIIGQVKVDAVCLDDFCRAHAIDKIDYLKLDVEGAELRALQGAHDLLAQRRIGHVQFEVSRKMLEGLQTTARPVFELLAQHGYACHSISEKGALGERVSDSDAFYENYIAQPSPQAAAVEGSDGLPIHFFTIVLNGQPFIKHHIQAFRQLPFTWHWHIIEGVAELNHDTAWSKEFGGRVTEALHLAGLSVDGTREYLDELAQAFPNNVTIYRKPAGSFWDGKLEMVNAPLPNLPAACLLWQVDADELWTQTQIIRSRELFLAHPTKTAAYYYCHYFVGENLAVATRDTYGNHSDFEWIRTWRYNRGCRWTAHEPPRLCQPGAKGSWVDLATLEPIKHADTEALGLVFQHFAYGTEEQLRFKEIYYGYAKATEHWRRLQECPSFPVKLAEFWPWVADHTQVDTAAALGIIPLVRKSSTGQWLCGSEIPANARFTQERAVAGSGSPRRILFVRTDSIGDGVLSSSMLPWIEKKFAPAEIAVLCQQHVAELYLHAPMVRSIICFDRTKLDDPAAWKQLVQEITEFGPDIVLNSTYSRDVLSDRLALAFADARHIAVHSDLSNRSEADRAEAERQYQQIIPTAEGMLGELQRHKEFLKVVGIEAPDLQPLVWTGAEEETLAQAFFRQHQLDPLKTLAVFPSTQHTIKDYLRFAEALEPFNEYSFLLFGGADARLACEQLATQLPGRVFNLAGLTRLPEMAALLRRCRLLVGSDSCGAHMACALGVPNVVVLGGGHFGRFFPYSSLTSVVSMPLECYGCNWQCRFDRPHCIKDIAPAAISEAVRQTLLAPSIRPRLFLPVVATEKTRTGQPRPVAPAELPGLPELDVIECNPVSNPAALPVAALQLVAQAEGALAKFDPASAIAALEQARRLAPRNPELLTALGNLYFQNNRMPEAKAVLAAANETSPSEPLLAVLLAHVCLRLEDVAGFESALTRALQLDPANPNARRLLADAHLQAGRFAEAGRIYGSLVQAGQADAEVLLALGRCFVELGNLEAARACYQEVLKQQPEHALGKENLAALERRSPAVPCSAQQIQPVPRQQEQVSCPVCYGRESHPVRRRADIVECHQCGTVYLRTRLTQEAMRQLYQSYADGGSHMALPASVADAERSGLARDYFLREILEFTEAKGGLLDVGCGWGGFLLNARKRGFRPQGIELTRKCVRYANEQLGIPVMDTVLDAAEIAPGSLRVVTMNHVLEHLPAPAGALAKVFASLEPGGMYCGIVPNFASACSTSQGDNWFWLDPQYHYTHFTPLTLRRLLEKAGFVVQRLYTATGDYGAENVRKACLAHDPKLADHDYFAAELKRYEADGRGEEIRFFARKPAQPALALHQTSSGDEPLVSVIVSAFNSANYLEARLQQLTQQTIFKRIEVIVVDSGSEQDERSIVVEFQKSHANIRYLRTERETLYASWNRGLAAARGRYWVNANTDDGLRTDALEVFVKAMEANPPAQLAYADCVWTSKPNDQFPSRNILKEVCYADYHPVQTWFYCITGCTQFWRTESLRKLGGFNGSLRYAGDYEVTVRLAAAHGVALHVPDFLSLFYQNPEGLTQKTGASSEEHTRVEAQARANLSIDRLFACRPNHPVDAARAWTTLGVYALSVRVPWERESFKQEEFAFDCFRKAFEIEPECPEVCLNYIVALDQGGRGHLIKPFEQSESVVMEEALARWRRGDSYETPNVRPAVTGAVFDAAQAHVGQLSAHAPPIRPWISRQDGRFNYLSKRLLPEPKGKQYTQKELERMGTHVFEVLRSFPPFHAQFGGAGDTLLLMSTFYDNEPGRIVLSYPNSIPAARALFEAFPALGPIYFLPVAEDPRVHAILRWIVRSLPNCLGAGATPKEGYDEWKAGLDIEKVYRINKAPKWAAAFRQQVGPGRVGLAPKGSLSGMVGSKRNLIDPQMWPQLIEQLLARGFEPVVLGTPDEDREYPILPGCVNARSRSFRQQMEEIGRSAVLIGADSWAKTFAGLARVPTIVFEPIKGADWVGKKDLSDFVFLEPWDSIKVVKDLAQCLQRFDQMIAKIPSDRVSSKNTGHSDAGAGARNSTHAGAASAKVAWVGSFLDSGSLSHVNRELTEALGRTQAIQVTRVSQSRSSALQSLPEEFKRIAHTIQHESLRNADVTVCHAWPPNWQRPKRGALVVIQPWEYGVLPQEWVRKAKEVDEFWVPSTFVRNSYIKSGINADKVHVVPNGVDPAKFSAHAKPMALSTKRRFKFLFVGGTIHRKGPDLLLKAYLETFTAADDVCLVIKDFGSDSIYAGQTLATQIQAAQQLTDAPEILYLKDDLAPEQLPGLYTACDCLAHPYRGEGFGLPVLEAMSCGLPVIVTAGGATEDFATDALAYRIEAKRKTIGHTVSGLELAGEGWLLESDASALAARLKWVAQNQEAARARGRAAAEHVKKSWTWDHAASKALERVQQIISRRGAAGSGNVSRVRSNDKGSALGERALPTPPKSQPKVAQLGNLDSARELFRQKKHADAWQATLSALQVRPCHPEAYVFLGEIALAVGAGHQARLCAERARQLAPDWKPARHFLTQRLKGTSCPDWLRLPSGQDASPRLSVCLIAKNEESFLAQCLKSIRELAHQIVVVDTGSTDRTVEIAREFGAEVHSFAWSDDFSAARNAALEHATGDWVLMLDADEELDLGSRGKLHKHLAEAAAIGWRLPLVDVGREVEGCSFVPRLYRNAPGLYYTGRVHEQVFTSVDALAQQWGLKTRLGEAKLVHQGYTAELTRGREKVGRNLRLLELAIREQPDDPHLLMHLGLELVRSGRQSEALEPYRLAFELLGSVHANQVVPELRETLLSQFCTHLAAIKRFEELTRVLNSRLARSGTGLTASLHFALGLAAMELGRFRDAVEQMEACLAKRNQRSLCPANKDIFTAAPYHCLGLCLSQLGEAASAEAAYQKGLKENGSVERLRIDYARFLFETNRPLEALQCLHESMAQNAQNSAFWRLGGQIALSQPQFIAFACDWTCEAIRYLPEDKTAIGQRAEALLLSQQIQPAAELWQELCRSDRQPASLAALILCSVAKDKLNYPTPSPSETSATTRAFLDWYRRLITFHADELLQAINQRLPQLRRVLPEAARLLQSALAQAGKPEEQVGVKT
jgi:FkbM family methyltransferase